MCNIVLCYLQLNLLIKVLILVKCCGFIALYSKLKRIWCVHCFLQPVTVTLSTFLSSGYSQRNLLKIVILCNSIGLWNVNQSSNATWSCFITFAVPCHQLALSFLFHIWDIILCVILGYWLCWCLLHLFSSSVLFWEWKCFIRHLSKVTKWSAFCFSGLCIKHQIAMCSIFKIMLCGTTSDLQTNSQARWSLHQGPVVPGVIKLILSSLKVNDNNNY